MKLIKFFTFNLKTFNSLVVGFRGQPIALNNPKLADKMTLKKIYNAESSNSIKLRYIAKMGFKAECRLNTGFIQGGPLLTCKATNDLHI